MTDQPTPDTKPACIHPDGYDGECPCPTGCGCCKVAPAADPLRDRIAAALYERERPPKDPVWPDAYAMDREVFEPMADAVLAVRDREMEQLREQLAARDAALAACTAQLVHDQAALARVRKVLAERRAEVAEREPDGMLPFGTPGASWCDAVTVTCDRIDDALRVFPSTVGIRCAPAHDGGPTVADCREADARWWNGEKGGE